LKSYKYHGSREQFTRDAGRERHLQEQGYRLISFSGSEVYKDPAKCVNEVLDFLRSLPTEPGTTPFGKPISPTTISSVTSSRSINPPISFQSPQVKTLDIAPARQVKLTARKRRTILGMEKWQIGVLVILGALVIITTLVLLAVILKSVSI
jgi:hypothetical protein